MSGKMNRSAHISTGHLAPMMEEEETLVQTAQALLRESDMTILDAVRLALELREAMPPGAEGKQASMQACHRLIQLGSQACKQEGRSTSFRVAFEASLQSRAGRRLRTIAEIRQCCRRVVRYFPDLSDTQVRSITPEDCRQFISTSFHTPNSRRKARRLLHGVFAFCLRHGWCAYNPLVAVDIPPVRERKIESLSLVQIRRLLATVLRPEHVACAPAVGIMLWAGVRPTEVTRLRWEHVRVEDRVIVIDAQHSKTGGARHVTLHKVLADWLCKTAPYRLPRTPIVPRAWVRRWRALRLAAGFADWNPDTLRHTFASYHLKHFENLNVLQIDMGHADTQLLRTRYLGMKGVTREGAEEFWKEKHPSRSRRRQ